MHNSEERNQHKMAATLPPRFEDLGPFEQLGDGKTQPEGRCIESSKSDNNNPVKVLDGEYQPPSWGALPRYVCLLLIFLALSLPTVKAM